jgi:hypothetical protein
MATRATRRRLDVPAGAPRYLTQSALAALLGVTSATFSGWLVRYSDEVPRPAALLDNGVPLWLVGGEDEWREWQRYHLNRWKKD